MLVTVLDTHCPDVCPLIATHLRATLARLGPPRGRTQLIAVSVDPRGDTPRVVARFLRLHGLTGRMQYLIGSPGQLVATWKAWRVGSQKDLTNPELIDHSALVYGMAASGKLTTVYPSNFKPAEIAHDVPLLARR